MAEPKAFPNFFVQELADILADHGETLASLPDLIVIGPETLARLQTSLTASSTSSPVLAPEELAQLGTALPLLKDEMRRLQAALLALAIRRLVASQIGADYAQSITQTIYPELVTAFQKFDPTQVRGDAGANEDTTIDRSWNFIRESRDAALLALQLSMGFSNHQAHLQEARSYLAEALEELELLPKAVKAQALWKKWQHQLQIDRQTIEQQEQTVMGRRKQP